MSPRIPAVTLALLASAGALAAQTRLSPGVVIRGEVVAKVTVTLSDDDTPYYPVARHRLAFFRSSTDSVVILTDESGTGVATLAAGDYRLVSLQPIEWKGTRYRWSLPLTVRSGMGLIDLTSENAVRIERTRHIAGGTERAAIEPLHERSTSADIEEARAASRPAGTPQIVMMPKDGGTAVLFSFLITGGGQFYAGESAKGAMFLVAGLVGGAMVVAGVNQEASCLYDDCGSDGSGLIVAGALVSFSAWISSMVDAPSSVRRYNARHGINVAQARPVSPVIARNRSGGAKVGLRLALR